jgi:hypothetical protein
MRSNIVHVISFLFMALSACDSESEMDNQSDASSSSGGLGSSGAGGAGSSSSAASSSGGGAASDKGEVPTSPEELFAFLKAGSYLNFPKESAIHDSAGPHFGNVRTYLTPSLDASLQAGNTEHPKGAAAVKELYMSGSEVKGWAVMVKIADKSDGGKGWYWYETTNIKEPSGGFSGEGLPLCTNCHMAGADFVLTPSPLQ